MSTTEITAEYEGDEYAAAQVTASAEVDDGILVVRLTDEGMIVDLYATASHKTVGQPVATNSLTYAEVVDCLLGASR